MKHIKLIIATLVISFMVSSCLTSGLKDLDVYEGNDITKVEAYYRYKTDDKHAVSGEQVVKQIQLAVKNDIKADAATADVTVSLPSNFPEAEKANITNQNLVIAFVVSTAAIVERVDGAPALGVPADWSKPNKYKIIAANGDAKIWTVNVTLNK